MRLQSAIWILVVAFVVAGGWRPAEAGSVTVDFEQSGYTPGESVHNHQPDGTEASPPIKNINVSTTQAWFIPARNTAAVDPDEEVVDTGGAHGKVWRLSQGKGTGSLGAAPQTPHMDGVAGETGALNDAGRGSVTTDTFFGQFDFRSATGAAQTGLVINVTAQAFDQRHGYVRILDNGSGFDLGFYDTIGTGFNFTSLDLDLSYTDWHTIGIEILFEDGFDSGTFGDTDVIGNDVVNIWVDGAIVHTGTTWESYYAGVQDHNESVDTLGFSAGTLANQLGGGLYFDNFLLDTIGPSAMSVVPLPAAVWPALLLLGGLGAVRRARRRRA